MQPLQDPGGRGFFTGCRLSPFESLHEENSLKPAFSVGTGEFTTFNEII